MSDLGKAEPDPKGDETLQDSDGEDIFYDARFSAEEEAELLTQSNAQKAEANKLFTAARYSEAISSYDRALSFCPNYLDYEIAVLRSNIAACHLKLEDWKAAVDAATASLACLDRALPPPTEASGKTQAAADNESGSVVEIEGDGDEEEQTELEKLMQRDARREDIKRIRAKSLMRRARAKMELAGWANLQAAEEDYKVLIGMDNLPAHDRKVVQKALMELPERIKLAKDKEIAEMMGKLKDLGNGILKPFGLSTDNFKFVKDEKTGGYSMSLER